MGVFHFQRHFLQPLFLTALGLACAWGSHSVRGVDAAASATTLLPGHSAHGESFNEGPRSAAYLMGGTGNVHFPVTCKTEVAQKFFDQGVGQLHGFWYFEAERSFRQVAAIDPNCVMAYWGMAMANTNNRARAREFIKEAEKRKTSAELKPVEIAWIDAIAAYYREPQKSKGDRNKILVADLKEMRKKFPDDIEVKAFLAVYIFEHNVKEEFATADKVLDEIFAVAPKHPAHHYRIHLMDNRSPKDGLASAAQCGQASPGIAHMWHMPGHIYSDLNRYTDAAWQQEASARVDHAYMIRDRVMPFQIFNYMHNNEWLCRDLLFVGRAHDAMDLAKNMIELPRHPTIGKGAFYGTARLIDTLSLHQMWDEYLALCASGYLSDDLDEDQLIRKIRYEGVAAAALKRNDIADRALARLKAQRKTVLKTAVATTQPASTPVRRKRNNKNSAPSTRPATTQPVVRVKTSLLQIINSLSPVLGGEGGGEGPFLRAAQLAGRPLTPTLSPEYGGEGAGNCSPQSNFTPTAVKAGAATRPGIALNPTTRPATTRPARTLAATTRPATTQPARYDRATTDKLAALDQAIDHINAQKALIAGDFTKAAALLTSAKARKEQIALAYVAAGNFAKSEELANKAVSEGKEQTYPLATQVLVLHRAGKKAEAAKAFEKLRDLSEAIDLTVEPYKALTEIAPDFGFKTDYRVARKTPKDIGQRPPLDSLGPFRWHPSAAPDWAAPSSPHSSISLSEYRGKPVIVLFYLGHGCPHCIRQIHAFATMAKQFTAAGISLVAIGTDTPDSLSQTWTMGEATDAAFPLASDVTMEIFKKYHCYDDFEKMPLHGTFLIDAQGLIRWQDISYDPFLNAEFLLKEAKRLIKN